MPSLSFNFKRDKDKKYYISIKSECEHYVVKDFIFGEKWSLIFFYTY